MEQVEIEQILRFIKWVFGDFLQFKPFSFLGQSKTTDKASGSLLVELNCNFS